MQIPSLQELDKAPLSSERLLLLPLTASLADEIFDAIDESREHLSRYEDGYRELVSVDDAHDLVLRSVDEWRKGQAARFAIVAKDDGRSLGSVSLEEVDARGECASLAYWIRADAARKGLTTEAAHEVVRWAFEACRFRRLRASIAVANHPSIRVIKRLRFRHEGTVKEAERVGDLWLDHHIYGLLATEWRK